MKTFVFVALSLLSAPGFADVYSYTGATVHCQISADRQEIGTAPKVLGTYGQDFGFQLFKTENAVPVFTAVTSGSNVSVSKALDVGGIPNSSAQENWAVTDKTESVTTSFNAPGVTIPMTFSVAYATPSSQGFWVEAHIPFSFDLSAAHDVLAGLGDHDTPDFVADPPIVSWPQKSLDTASAPLMWSVNPTQLFEVRNKFGGQRDKSVVQINYPPEKMAGRSYHILFECDPF